MTAVARTRRRGRWWWLLLPVAVGGALLWAWPRAGPEQGPAVALRPLAGRRLLVIAPHCDDETLGAGGLIQRAVASGARVRVVVVTNGDGFPLAAETQSRRLWLRRADYLRLAHVRQEETLAALAVLGVPASRVSFLGYPDRGLLPMWEWHWWPAPPYRSRYTRETANPYDTSLSPGAPYRAEAVVADLMRVLREEQPTDLVLPHPNDAHPDHWATSAMTRFALARLEGDLRPFPRPQLHAYLVHRGSRFPSPLGYHPQAPLLPPPALSAAGSFWVEVPLTAGQRARKRLALSCYRSQMRLLGWFLSSFVRCNELFATLEERTLPLMGVSGDAPRLLALDPLRDTVLRNVDAAGDFTSIAACCSDVDLHIRVSTRRPGKRGVRCRVFVHPVPEGRPLYCEARPGRPVVWRRVGEAKPIPGAGGRFEGQALVLQVPRQALSGSWGVMLSAESRLFRLRVDRTACVLAEFPPGLSPPLSPLHLGSPGAGSTRQGADKGFGGKGR